MITAENILSISKNQGFTCMYSLEELLTFSQEKLEAIYSGVEALGGARPCMKRKSLRELIGRGSGRKRKKKNKVRGSKA